MIACTSPLFTARFRPLRIFLPSTSTCRSWMSNKGIRIISLVQASSRGKPRKMRAEWLSDRAFQADRDQLLRLDGEFHRQLLQHVLDEAVDHQRGGLFRREPALPAI